MSLGLALAGLEMSKKKKKPNLFKEIISGMLGICTCVVSQLFKVTLNQISTRAELERLREGSALVKSDFLITRESGFSDLILAIGISVVILAVYSAFNKYFDWRNKK